MGERTPDGPWEFRYLGISPTCELARQQVTDDFDGWEFVSFCYQSHDRQWFCLFKQPARPVARRDLAA